MSEVVWNTNASDKQSKTDFGEIRGNAGAYQLCAPFERAAGFCQWTFARKDGIEYFIKRFVKHKLPNKEKVGEAAYNKMAKPALAWAKQQQEVYTAICACGYGNAYQPPRGCGNIVAPFDFFMYDGSFYLATEKVEASSLPFHEICRLDMEKKEILMRVLARDMYALAENQVVHSDLKPDNLILKETKDGYYTLKIIDFDQSFISGRTQEDDSLGGDQTYCPPEYFDAWDKKRSKSTLTPKSDIFALGMIFHQILSGRLPAFHAPAGEKCIGDAMRSGGSIMLAQEIPEVYQNLIGWMICPEVSRITASQVFTQLYSMDIRR